MSKRSRGQIRLDVPHRIYRTPKIADRRITLSDCQGEQRQMFITGLGHEHPTVPLTNDLRSSPSKRIARDAQRTLSENSLADAVDFFHLDVLSSAVGMKIDLDATLTQVATAQVEITGQRVQLTLPKRAHNPLPIAAGFGEKPTPIPWWHGLPLHI